MKRFKFLFLLLLIIAATMTFAWEEDMLNLKVPTNLKAGSIVVDIEHRLLSRFNGANFDLGLRGVIWSKLELNSSYAKYMYNPRDNTKNEFTIGASYTYFLPKLFRGQVDVQFFSYEKELSNTRKQNLFYQLSLQNEPIMKSLRLAMNLAYDGDNKQVGLGAGLNVGFNVSFGPIQRLNLVGEYYPVIKGDNAITGTKNCFSAGLTFGTYGHHFMFMLGNSVEMGSRRLMLGAPKNTMYFGFNIQRHLDFKTL